MVLVTFSISYLDRSGYILVKYHALRMVVTIDPINMLRYPGKFFVKLKGYTMGKTHQLRLISSFLIVVVTSTLSYKYFIYITTYFYKKERPMTLH